MGEKNVAESFSKDVQKYLDGKRSERQESFEQLLRWAEQIQALGGIFSTLAWYEKENNHTDALELYGEDYGLAINTISELIKNKLNEIYHA
jgi:hypothetical protein